MNPEQGSIKYHFEEQTTSEVPLEKLGLAPQEIALYPNLTARENLKFYGGQYKIPSQELSEITDHLLERFELKDHANKQIKAFSGGMKRRINLITALLHNPNLLILDEPTTGVDVQSRHVIHEFLKEENEKIQNEFEMMK